MNLLNANSKIKRSKFELKIEQKFMIIEYHQKNPKLKNTQLIEYFNKQFGIKIQDKIEVLNKRIRECKFPELERMIHLWQTIALSKGVMISDDILIQKGKEFGTMLGIVEGYSFNYSSGWLRNFKLKYNLKQFELHGESGSVSQETIDISRKEE